MAVIRQADATRIARDAIVLDLGDISRQGERIKKKAEDDARRIIENAHAERARLISDAAEIGRKDGHREGFEKGLTEGRQQGIAEARAAAEAQYTALCESWSASFETFEAHREDALVHARLDLLRFAVAFAERITRRLIDLDSDAIKAQLDAALSLVTDATRLRIELHPDDVPTTQEVLPSLLARLTASAHSEITPIPDLTRGSCRIRTEHGLIDASIETQIQRLIEAALPADGLRLNDRIQPQQQSVPQNAKDAAA